MTLHRQILNPTERLGFQRHQKLLVLFPVMVMSQTQFQGTAGACAR
jgi:hypothetical protein